MINFDYCKIMINGSGIAAENASIDSSNSLSPVYAIGKVGIANQIPNGPLRTSFRFNYLPQIENEPIYALVSGIKIATGQLDWTGVQIVLGGLTGYNCYLDNLSYRAAPNELVRAAVSFVTYLPLSGQLTTGKTDVSIDSVSYGWATYVLSGNAYLLTPTYAFDYNFSANWQPVFILGQKSPIEMKLTSASEKIDLTRDTFYKIAFSGDNAESFLTFQGTDNKYVDIQNLSLVCQTEGIGTAPAGLKTLRFDLSGAKVTNSRLDAKVDDIIRVATSIEKFY